MATIMTSNRIQNCFQIPRVKIVGLIFLLLATAVLALSGCAYFWMEPYGSAASDVSSVRTDGKGVQLPENAPSISQGYNPAPYDVITTEHVHNHTGIDIIGKRGTPVLAPASGLVIRSYFEPMYGHHIEIDLGSDEKGRSVQANFLHLKKRLVQEGDTVSRGQQIGTLGATGLLAGGLPHLHYEIYVGIEQKALEPINPHRLWADGTGMVTCYDNSRTWPETPPLTTTYPVPCRGVTWQ